MRLLVVTRERNADKRYGLAKSLMPVLEALGQRGVHWRYLCQEEAGERGWGVVRRVHAWLVPPLKWIFRGTDMYSLTWGVLERLNMGRLAARIARRDGYSHVHCHDPIIAAGLRLATFARRGGLRWGVTEHGFGSYTQALHEDGARLGGHMMRMLRARERAILHAADWVIAPTRASLKQLARDLCVPEVPPHWHAIPHPLPPLPQLDRWRARAELGWDQGQVVLAVGRLVPLKGFPDVIAAFAAVARPDSLLVILGDGDAAPLQALAATLGVGGQVRIASTDAIWPYYAGADVYVSASETESFGMANLEALAMGVPAVCTAVGGVGEVVGAAAVLVSAGDRQALTGALRNLLKQPSERARLAGLGRARGAAWPSAATIADAYLAAYGVLPAAAAIAPAPERAGDAPDARPGLFVPIQLLECPADVRVMVLAPHPDDETLGCGATIARLAADGAHVVVVFVSDGGMGDPQGYCGGDVVSTRKAEAERATRALGVAEVRFLGFPDGELVADAALERAIAGVWKEMEPDWVFTTATVDAHRDHMVVGQLARGIRDRDRPAVRLFEYETWMPVAANRLVDVTESYARKCDAIDAYELPLRYVDYRTAAEGMARYRAIHLPGGKGYAEAFREVSND
ncbi:MAG: PIG-L family deacetylase [Rhodocyclales bacterium]|nr:PIG-L family deacetylase [Rhodocyclales bacterium]